MQVTKIEGRVAQILDDRRLVINRGEADGVRPGMKFEILSESTLPITDPETGQTLDELDQVKVRVKATEVRERIAICSTYEVRVVGGLTVPSLQHPLVELFAPARKVPVRLRVESSEQPSGLDPEESYVRRGDRAVQLLDPADS